MDFDGDFLEKEIASICYILSILYKNHVPCNGQNAHFSLKKTELSISFLANKMWPFRINKKHTTVLLPKYLFKKKTERNV